MIILLLFLAMIVGEVFLSSKVKQENWQSFKLFQMTPKKMKSIGIVLVLLVISINLVIVFLAMNVLSPYIILFLVITIAISFVPFLVTTIRFFLAKRNPIRFYPIVSVGILLVITIVHFLMIISAPINAFTSYQAKKLPEITSGKFPFRVVYELDGEEHIMEDVLICEFAGLSDDSRRWKWRFKYDLEATAFDGFRDDLSILRGENMSSIFRPHYMNESFNIFVNAGSCTYYMEDRRHAGKPVVKINERQITNESKEGRRTILVQDSNITNKQLERHFGIKIIEFNFSEPIKNRFN